MGTTQRRAHPPLISELLQDPSSFEFFRAMQILEDYLTSQGKKSIGTDNEPDEFGLRLRGDPSLSFPSTPITMVEAPGDSKAAGSHDAGEDDFQMTISFLGLVGATGTLPLHYTETLLHRLHEKDKALSVFLNGLQERTTSLFYRAWKKHRMAVTFAATELERGKADPILRLFLGLVGRLPRYRGKAISEEELCEVNHAGLFANRRRSARGLQAMVSGLLRCKVQVEQFVGQWVVLDEGARSRLGGVGPRSSMSGVAARLGEETVLGTRVWSVDSRVRIVAGPLDRSRFRALWPGGSPVQYLRKAVQTYLGPLIEYDLEWELAPDAPTPLKLGGEQMLGRDCWLGWSPEKGPDLHVRSPDWSASH